MSEPYHLTLATPPVGDVVFFDYKPAFHCSEPLHWTRWFYKVVAHHNDGRLGELKPLRKQVSNIVGWVIDDIGAVRFEKPVAWVDAE